VAPIGGNRVDVYTPSLVMRPMIGTTALVFLIFLTVVLVLNP
jgi:hypothetical protein